MKEDKTGLDEWKRAIVYMVWGEKFIDQAIQSALSAGFLGIPIILITDSASVRWLPNDHPFEQIVEVKTFRSYDWLNKSTLWNHLPEDYNSFLYLDTDTAILKDITLGFEKAERFGLAASQATSYDLPEHHDFRRIMAAKGLRDAGQLQYNAGVYFFIRRNDVRAVFELYQKMAYELSQEFNYRNRANKKADQPFLTFAMELLNFNPYTLSINYCYRALDAEPINGDVIIWHSHYPVPKSINKYEHSFAPRRRYLGSRSIDISPLY